MSGEPEVPQPQKVRMIKKRKGRGLGALEFMRKRVVKWITTGDRTIVHEHGKPPSKEDRRRAVIRAKRKPAPLGRYRGPILGFPLSKSCRGRARKA